MVDIQLELTRIAGELKISLETDANGQIVGVHLNPYSALRGFETLVKGRGFTFVVPAVMRICGVCHAVQGAAVCEAVEDALGIRPPREGLLLREASVLVNRLQSHFLQFFLTIPDFAPPKKVRDLQQDTLTGLEQASRLLQMIGGSSVHPFNLAIGGMNQSLTAKVKDKILETEDELESLIESFSKEFEECLGESPMTEQMKKISFVGPYLATDLFYGSPTRVNPDFVGKSDSSGNALSLVYSDRPTEVGPRARLNKFLGFTDMSILGIQRARLRELKLAVERIKEIFRVLNLDAPVKLTEVPVRSGKGIGVVEAPRGTLIHLVELDPDGCIKSLKIFTPTQFNFSAVKEVLKGVPAKLAEVILRIYDPCIPCVIH